MNPHLKVAYDQGVQKALIDAGLTKEALLAAPLSIFSGEENPIWDNYGKPAAGLGLGALFGGGLATLASRGKIPFAKSFRPSPVEGAIAGGLGGVLGVGIRDIVDGDD